MYVVLGHPLPALLFIDRCPNVKNPLNKTGSVNQYFKQMTLTQNTFLTSNISSVHWNANKSHYWNTAGQFYIYTFMYNTFYVHKCMYICVLASSDHWASRVAQIIHLRTIKCTNIVSLHEVAFTLGFICFGVLLLLLACVFPLLGKDLSPWLPDLPIRGQCGPLVVRSTTAPSGCVRLNKVTTLAHSVTYRHR